MATNNANNKAPSILRTNFFGYGVAFSPTTAQFAVSSADTIRTFPFVLPYDLTISKLTFEVTTAQAATTAIFGIYSKDGNTKYLDSGTSSVASTGFKTITLGSPVVMEAGSYIFASSATGTSAQGRAFTAVDYMNSGAGMMNAFVTRAGIATNTVSAGVMPSTLGTITGGEINPIIVLFSAE